MRGKYRYIAGVHTYTHTRKKNAHTMHACSRAKKNHEKQSKAWQRAQRRTRKARHGMVTGTGSMVVVKASFEEGKGQHGTGRKAGHPGRQKARNRHGVVAKARAKGDVVVAGQVVV